MKASLTLHFCCRCLDNLGHAHQSFEKLDLHNNDFHLPSSSAMKGTLLKGLCSLTLLGSVSARESWGLHSSAPIIQTMKPLNIFLTLK